MNPALPPEAKRAAGLPLVLVVLVAFSILPELIFQLADRGVVPFPDMRMWCFALGSFQPDLLKRSGPLFGIQPLTMFFTYGFLHTGAFHLVINMLGLVWLGRLILSYRTSETFVLIYLMSMVGAAELFILIGAGSDSVVGASGALFGLFGVYVVDSGLLALSTPPKEDARWQFFRLLLATLALALADVASQSLLGSPVAWQAHAGGFLTGAVVALLLPPRYRAMH